MTLLPTPDTMREHAATLRATDPTTADLLVRAADRLDGFEFDMTITLAAISDMGVGDRFEALLRKARASLQTH
jgi:hypothetical protein